MSNNDRSRSTDSHDFEETGSQSSQNGELLPEIQSALAKGLREFGEIYDMSSQPEAILNIYSCLEKALKSCGLPALTDSNYIPGNSTTRQRKKGKVSGYTEYTRVAWARYREEKKSNLKNETNLTPQDMMSEFARQWKALSPSQKQPYEEMASQRNNPALNLNNQPAIKKKIMRRKGPLSGYQYFVTVTKCPENIQSTEQMKYKAKLWACLSQEEKISYKIKSEESFWQENPDLFEENQQRLAELALREEERKLNAQNTVYNKPVLTRPTLVKVPNPHMKKEDDSMHSGQALRNEDFGTQSSSCRNLKVLPTKPLKPELNSPEVKVERETQEIENTDKKTGAIAQVHTMPVRIEKIPTKSNPQILVKPTIKLPIGTKD